MTHDGLNRFVVNPKRVKVACKPAAEGVPAMPAGNGIITLEEMRFRLVL